MRLAPCIDCQRHADADAGPCPFCGGTLSTPPRRVPPKAFRLTRAAVFYFGLGASSGCGEAGEPPPPPIEAPVANPYGAPVVLEEERAATDPDDGEARPDEEAAEDSASEAERREEILRTLRGINSAPAYGAPTLPPE